MQMFKSFEHIDLEMQMFKPFEHIDTLRCKCLNHLNTLIPLRCKCLNHLNTLIPRDANV